MFLVTVKPDVEKATEVGAKPKECAVPVVTVINDAVEVILDVENCGRGFVALVKPQSHVCDLPYVFVVAVLVSSAVCAVVVPMKAFASFVAVMA